MRPLPQIKIPPMIPIEKLMDMKWGIVEICGPHRGASFEVDRCTRLGRSPSECNLVFAMDTPGISKLHCELIPKDSGVQIRDMNSTYGTFLGDGTRLSPGQLALLRPGDTFYLATKEVSFQIQ